MSELFFVDTNVLVYARDSNDTQKQKEVQQWLDFLWGSRRGRLSVQVLSEFFSVARKLHNSTPGDRLEQEFVNDIKLYMNWSPAPLTTDTFLLACEIRSKAKVAWWDAMIIASASICGCRYILSQDFQNNFEYMGTKVISPFAVAPEKLVGA